MFLEFNNTNYNSKYSLKRVTQNFYDATRFVLFKISSGT